MKVPYGVWATAIPRQIHYLYLYQVLQVTANKVVHRIPEYMCLGLILLGAEGMGRSMWREMGDKMADFLSQPSRRARKKERPEIMGE